MLSETLACQSQRQAQQVLLANLFVLFLFELNPINSSLFEAHFRKLNIADSKQVLACFLIKFKSFDYRVRSCVYVVDV